MQVLKGLGILAAFIAVNLAMLLPIRFLTKIPSFIFRKLLHTVAIIGISLMIPLSENWAAAAITSGLLAVINYSVNNPDESGPF